MQCAIGIRGDARAAAGHAGALEEQVSSLHGVPKAGHGGRQGAHPHFVASFPGLSAPRCFVQEAQSAHQRGGRGR